MIGWNYRCERLRGPGVFGCPANVVGGVAWPLPARSELRFRSQPAKGRLRLPECRYSEPSASPRR